MKRRDFFKAAMWGGALMIFGKGVALAKEYYPVQVDETLWQGINRVKNPAEESELEKLHSPVMKVPARAKAGKVFPVLSATCALRSGLCGSVGTRTERHTEWRNRKDLKRDTRLIAK